MCAFVCACVAGDASTGWWPPELSPRQYPAGIVQSMPIRLKEWAHDAGVPLQTAYRLWRDGKLPSELNARKLGGCIFVDASRSTELRVRVDMEQYDRMREELRRLSAQVERLTDMVARMTDAHEAAAATASGDSASPLRLVLAAPEPTSQDMMSEDGDLASQLAERLNDIPFVPAPTGRWLTGVADVIAKNDATVNEVASALAWAWGDSQSFWCRSGQLPTPSRMRQLLREFADPDRAALVGPLVDEVNTVIRSWDEQGSNAVHDAVARERAWAALDSNGWSSADIAFWMRWVQSSNQYWRGKIDRFPTKSRLADIRRECLQKTSLADVDEATLAEAQGLCGVWKDGIETLSPGAAVTVTPEWTSRAVALLRGHAGVSTARDEWEQTLRWMCAPEHARYYADGGFPRPETITKAQARRAGRPGGTSFSPGVADTARAGNSRPEVRVGAAPAWMLNSEGR